MPMLLERLPPPVPGPLPGPRRVRPAAALLAGLVLVAGCEDPEPPAAGDPGVRPAAARTGPDLESDPPPPDTLPVAAALRNRLEAGLAGEAATAAGRRIRSIESVPAFYLERDFQPVWLTGARPTEPAVTLLDEIRAVELDGLDPAAYHLAALDSLVARRDADPEEELRRRVDLELLLTDAFLLLGSHLLVGRVNPETREPEWRANRRGADPAAVLELALEAGDVAGALEGLRPQEDTYRGLRRALAHYRRVALAGGWASVPGGPNLAPGESDPRLPALRARLVATGDLDPDGAGPGDLYDEETAAAVRRFQERYGLEADGRVGPATLRAMNVPVEARIAQLEVNLERWRWMPTELGDRYFLVNIPGFEVQLREEGQPVRRIRAIVGRAYRQTPVFSGTMTYLVLAPHWHVPPGIAANDQLPRIRENPGYVASQRMVLLDQATNRPVDPHSVGWAGMTGSEFNRRFRLRQDPGPTNALGDVKFMFPNRHNVYLHDTPGRDLFDRAARDFSSGCIRVEGAVELAVHLLRGDPAWTETRIREVIRGGRERYVTLPEPYQVHLQYWTAWLDEAGRVHFRDDIYGRDPAVRRALDAEAPRDD